jgi:hypothetical protein
VVVGWCTSGSISRPGAWATASGCTVVATDFSTNLQIGLAGSTGGGGSTGFSGGLSTGPLLCNGSQLSDLNGPFPTAGVTFQAGRSIGFDAFVGRGTNGDVVSGGSAQYGVGGAWSPGPSLPLEFHGGATTTATVDMGPILVDQALTKFLPLLTD